MAEYSISFPFTSSSITSVTASTAATTLLSSDPNEGKFLLMHSGSSRAYVLFSSGTPSSTNWSIFMDNGDYYEERDYKGQVNIIFASQSNGTYVSATKFTK